MSRRTGFRRKWGRWRPSEAQRRVLDALVEGKTNAAIAGELGISAETVKWHVSELLAETGLPDRQALAQWWTRERERSQRPALLPHLFHWRASPLVPASLVVAVLLVLVPVVAFLVFDRTGPESADPLVGLDIGGVALPESMREAAEPPETCEPPEQLDLRIVRPDELLAEGLTPAGRLITPLHCPIYAANRADRAFAWVGGAGVIELHGLDGWQLGRASEAVLSFHHGLPSPEARFLEVGPVGLRSELAGPGLDLDEAQGVAVTRRTHEDGTYLLVAMQQQGFRRVALASDGRLFVDERAPAQTLVVNQEPGERIDVSGMVGLGALPAEERPVTECRAGGSCAVRVTIRNSVVPAPVAGVLECPEPGFVPSARDFELDAGEFVLEFRSIDPNRAGRMRPGAPGVPTPAADTWTCEERAISPGDSLPVHEDVAIVEITARRPDGSGLSVAAAYDGTLFVGEVTLAHACGVLEFC